MSMLIERVWDEDFKHSLILESDDHGGVTVTVDLDDDTDTIRLDATQLRKLRLFITRLERRQKT